MSRVVVDTRWRYWRCWCWRWGKKSDIGLNTSRRTMKPKGTVSLFCKMNIFENWKFCEFWAAIATNKVLSHSKVLKEINASRCREKIFLRKWIEDTSRTLKYAENKLFLSTYLMILWVLVVDISLNSEDFTKVPKSHEKLKFHQNCENYANCLCITKLSIFSLISWDYTKNLRFHSNCQDFNKVSRFHSKFQYFTKWSRFYPECQIFNKLLRFN